jgi:DNA-directed RNA polymerase specialized sigma24 family protein
MPLKRSLPRTLDLFEYTLTIPTPPSEPAVSAKPPALAKLSDVQLAQQLGQLLEEMQRRLGNGTGQRPVLEAAARQASGSLKGLVPSPTKRDRLSRTSKALSSLQEGQRKAVCAALLAGVAPSQVAKHFGLSLAVVRKVLAETA